MAWRMLDTLQESTGLITLTLAGITAWWAVQILQAWVWHPLSAFPGPRLAALTTYYKFWIDCVVKGSFIHTLEKLHEQYGMATCFHVG
jgi:hypothetical protein